MKRILIMLAGTVSLYSLFGITNAEATTGIPALPATDSAALVPGIPAPVAQVPNSMAPTPVAAQVPNVVAQNPSATGTPSITMVATSNSAMPGLTPAASPSTPGLATAAPGPVTAIASTAAASQVQTLPAPSTVAPTAPQAQAPAPAPATFFSQIKLPEEKKITCQEAISKFAIGKSIICDFSKTSDFKENGDRYMSEAYSQIVSTKAFGTGSTNIYWILTKTGVTTEIAGKWLDRCKQDGRICALNVAENPNIGDDIMPRIIANFKNISLLNLSGTSITDAGLNALTSKITADGLGSIKLSGTSTTDAGLNAPTSKITADELGGIKRIDISRTKVTEAAVAALRAAIKAKAPDAGDDIVSYEKSPDVLPTVISTAPATSSTFAPTANTATIAPTVTTTANNADIIAAAMKAASLVPAPVLAAVPAPVTIAQQTPTAPTPAVAVS